MSPSFGTGFGFVNPLCDHTALCVQHADPGLGTQQVLLIDGYVVDLAGGIENLPTSERSWGFGPNFGKKKTYF